MASAVAPRSCLYECPTRTFRGSSRFYNILCVNVCGLFSSVETKHNYLEPYPRVRHLIHPLDTRLNAPGWPE